MAGWLILNKFKIIFIIGFLCIYFSPFIRIIFNPVLLIPIFFLAFLVKNEKQKIFHFLILLLIVIAFLPKLSNERWINNLKKEDGIEKVFNLYGREFYRLKGKIERIEKFSKGFDTYLFNIEEVELYGKKIKVSIPSFLRIKKRKSTNFFFEGDIVSLLGKVKDWKGLKDDFQIGKFFYFASRNRFLEIYSKPEFVEVIKRAKESFRMKYFSFVVKKFRNLKNLDILLALLFGVKSGNFGTYRTYTEAGLYHLLVISGFHIGLIALLIFLPLKFFMRRKFSLLISFLLISLYISFINCSPATLRAYLMVFLFTALFMVNRKISLSEIISLAGIILLFSNPFFIYHLGFLLSFISLYAIAFIFVPINEKFLMPIYDGARFIFSEKFDVSDGIRAYRGRKLRFSIERLHFYFFNFMKKEHYRFITKNLLKILFNLSGLFFIAFSINLVIFLLSGNFNIFVQPLSLFTSIISTYLISIILFFLLLSIPLFFIFSKISLIFLNFSIYFIKYLNSVALLRNLKPLFVGKIPFFVLVVLLSLVALFAKKCKRLTSFILFSILIVFILQIHFNTSKAMRITIFDAGRKMPVMISLKRENLLISPWDLRNLIYTDEIFLPYMREKNIKNISVIIPKGIRSYIWPLMKLSYFGLLDKVYIQKNETNEKLKRFNIKYFPIKSSISKIKIFDTDPFLLCKYKKSKFLIAFKNEIRKDNFSGVYNFVLSDRGILKRVTGVNSTLFIFKKYKPTDFSANAKVFDISTLGEMEIFLNERGIEKVSFPYLEKLERSKIILNNLKLY